MTNVAVIDGHPDPSPGRLLHALSERYAAAARDAGHDVRRIDVAKMQFPVLRSEAEYAQSAPEAIVQAQRDISWASHLAIFYPLWDGDMPALLKAFFEQLLRPGFALDSGGRFGFPKKLLTGKSARVIVTMGMPALAYRTYFGAFSLKSFKRSTLNLCGISPVHDTVLGGLFNASLAKRERWLDLMAALAVEDTGPRQPRRAQVRALVRTGVTLGTAYVVYTLTSRVRHGMTKRKVPGDALLDRVMPSYDVRTQHCIGVNAPAATTFAAVHDTDLEGSPVVRALFRAREVLLGAKHETAVLPHGLFDQAAALGWRVVAQIPGREVVFGAVTQPWMPNPAFRGLPPDEFARFNAPGFAKIAFSLRVDPVTAATSCARTETRVQTTDRISRKRFRRYWALLSAGIALIRVVLLRQVKTEAENSALTRARL